MWDKFIAKTSPIYAFFFFLLKKAKNVNNLLIGLQMLSCSEKTMLFGRDQLQTYRVLGVNKERKRVLCFSWIK